MRDLELILRFFALSDRGILEGDNVPYNISLKKYLNEYMGDHNTAQDVERLKEQFNETRH